MSSFPLNHLTEALNRKSIGPSTLAKICTRYPSWLCSTKTRVSRFSSLHRQLFWPDHERSVNQLFIQALSNSITGTSSDILYKNYGLQRIWLVVVSAVIFCFSQIFALNVENPHQLWLVSFLSGLGYGVLFGVFPTIVRSVSPPPPPGGAFQDLAHSENCDYCLSYCLSYYLSYYLSWVPHLWGFTLLTGFQTNLLSTRPQRLLGFMGCHKTGEQWPFLPLFRARSLICFMVGPIYQSLHGGFFFVHTILQICAHGPLPHIEHISAYRAWRREKTLFWSLTPRCFRNLAAEKETYRKRKRKREKERKRNGMEKRKDSLLTMQTRSDIWRP